MKQWKFMKFKTMSPEELCEFLWQNGAQRINPRRDLGRLKKIYVCSPYRGFVEQNEYYAALYCKYVISKGYLPIAPHLYFTQFLDDNDDDQRRIGMAFGQYLLDDCDEIWVFGDKVTSGMATEIAYALEWGVPVRYFNVDCRFKGYPDCLAFEEITPAGTNTLNGPCCENCKWHDDAEGCTCDFMRAVKIADGKVVFCEAQEALDA